MSRRTEDLNQHHYSNTNPMRPFSYSIQCVTPTKRNIQHDTDVITQSRSFQMLQGWISESEKTLPHTVPTELSRSLTTSKVTRSLINESNDSSDHRLSLGGTTSQSFHHFQDQTPQRSSLTTTIETKPLRNTTGLRSSLDKETPSRAFKYLQEQYRGTSPPSLLNRSQMVNNREDLVEIYNKIPPSFREREPEAPRYKGATIPSRSFRFLQMMTENKEDNDDNDDMKSNFSYRKPEQLTNKYDEKNLLINTNQLNEHPSRSFKYLQEMTGEQRTKQRFGSLTNDNHSTNFNASDF